MDKERHNRNSIVLDSKCACPNLITMHINRMSPQEISHDLHESLRNLNTDHLDFTGCIMTIRNGRLRKY